MDEGPFDVISIGFFSRSTVMKALEEKAPLDTPDRSFFFSEGDCPASILKSLGVSEVMGLCQNMIPAANFGNLLGKLLKGDKKSWIQPVQVQFIDQTTMPDGQKGLLVYFGYEPVKKGSGKLKRPRKTTVLTEDEGEGEEEDDETNNARVSHDTHQKKAALAAEFCAQDPATGKFYLRLANKADFRADLFEHAAMQLAKVMITRGENSAKASRLLTKHFADVNSQIRTKMLKGSKLDARLAEAALWHSKYKHKEQHPSNTSARQQVPTSMPSRQYHQTPASEAAIQLRPSTGAPRFNTGHMQVPYSSGSSGDTERQGGAFQQPQQATTLQQLLAQSPGQTAARLYQLRNTPTRNLQVQQQAMQQLQVQQQPMQQQPMQQQPMQQHPMQQQHMQQQHVQQPEQLQHVPQQVPLAAPVYSDFQQQLATNLNIAKPAKAGAAVAGAQKKKAQKAGTGKPSKKPKRGKKQVEVDRVSETTATSVDDEEEEEEEDDNRPLSRFTRK